MPNDIFIIAPLSRFKKDSVGNYILDSEGHRIPITKDQTRGTGFTEFIFEPYENDLQFDRMKRARVVSGVDKLVQSVMRVILTAKGDSFEDVQWGSELNSSIGSKIDNTSFSVVRESVIKALVHYNELNSDNPNSDEVINTIDEIQVVSDPNDPRVIRILVGITTESGKGVRVVVPQVAN